MADFEKRAIFEVFGVFSLHHLKHQQHQKSQKSLFFRSPTRFLIQIFFIGPEILCSLWKYKISRYWCSLLVIFGDFHTFSGPIMVKKWCDTNWKWRITSSNDEKWYIMTKYNVFPVFLSDFKSRINSNHIETSQIVKNAKKPNFSFISKNVPEIGNFSKSSFSELRRDFWFKSFLLD